MEASLCGVVSICSPVRAYTDVISHGKNGLIAETREQWLDAIERLLADADVYASMRDQASLMPVICSGPNVRMLSGRAGFPVRRRSCQTVVHVRRSLSSMSFLPRRALAVPPARLRTMSMTCSMIPMWITTSLCCARIMTIGNPIHLS